MWYLVRSPAIFQPWGGDSVSDARILASDDFMALARLALAGKSKDVQLFLGKAARKYRAVDPEFSAQIAELLSHSSSRSSALRREPGVPVPVDGDSRLHLLRIEEPSESVTGPILAPAVDAKISGIIRERKHLDRLLKAGIEPTRTALFVGPPGVGKTLSARWIAAQLHLPLLVLDLSAVMSSFLGRTGNNVRAVLDYAKRQDCVLLLDEFDSIAKRRDDATEIGELKRLVTVLLQEIDEWPSSGILVAATNHPELLDPAVWRRFDHVIEFPRPALTEIEAALHTFLGSENLSQEWISILATIFRKQSYSDIERAITNIRRTAALEDRVVDREVETFAKDWASMVPHNERIALAQQLSAVPELSQRRVSEITGVSRDTLRSRASRKPTTRKHEEADG
jgi:hypothetical protein